MESFFLHLNWYYMSYNKLGCVFPMVISSDFRMGEHRDDDHEEDAPYFISLLLPKQNLNVIKFFIFRAYNTNIATILSTIATSWGRRTSYLYRTASFLYYVECHIFHEEWYGATNKEAEKLSSSTATISRISKSQQIESIGNWKIL